MWWMIDETDDLICYDKNLLLNFDWEVPQDDDGNFWWDWA